MTYRRSLDLAYFRKTDRALFKPNSEESSHKAESTFENNRGCICTKSSLYDDEQQKKNPAKTIHSLRTHVPACVRLLKIKIRFTL